MIKPHILIVISFFFLTSATCFRNLALSQSQLSVDIDECKNFQYNYTDFAKDKMLGIWYPLNQTENTKIFSSCDYLTLSKGTTNDIEMTAEIRKRNPDGLSVAKTLKLKKTRNPNSFIYRIYGFDNVLTIISTDYDNYAIAYYCHDFLIMRGYNAVILSRNKTMSARTFTKLSNEIKEKLKESKLKKVKQLNC